MGTPHGGATKYYDPTTKVVYDAVTAEADDLNDINTAVDAAFGLVADDLDALALAIDSSLAENWASDPLGTNPDPLQPTKYSALANSEVAEEWAIGTPIDQDGVPTGDLSAKAEALAAAADVVLTHADVVLTGLDVDATNADVVLTHADVVLTGLDVDSTNADVVLTHADVVLTGLDAVDTAQDSVDTNADLLATASIYDEFDDRYLGDKTSAPSVDNDGDALIQGALYWNSTTGGRMYCWNGSAWIAAYVPSTEYVAQTDPTGSAELPKGTTAERDGAGVVDAGFLRFNTDTDETELYDGTSWSAVTKRARRNLIINGGFDVWQRGASFPSAVKDDYTADRFAYLKEGSHVVDITKSTDVPTLLDGASFESNYSVEIDVTTAEATVDAGDFLILEQKIEGYSLQHMDGRPVTLSFWVKATKVGTYCVSFRDGSSSASYISEYTIDVTDTWEKKTITLTVDTTTGTWNYTTSSGLGVAFILMAGSTFQTTPDAWTAGNYVATANQVNGADSTSNLFRLSQVQLEVGTMASEFEERSTSDELDLCQRYYWQGRSTGNGAGYLWAGQVAGPVHGPFINFPVSLRSIPTMSDDGLGVYTNCEDNVTKFEADNRWFHHRLNSLSIAKYRCYYATYYADAEL